MGEEATIAAPTAQAPQQRRPLRESVLDGRFFGQQDSGAAGGLAASSTASWGSVKRWKRGSARR